MLYTHVQASKLFCLASGQAPTITWHQWSTQRVPRYLHFLIWLPRNLSQTLPCLWRPSAFLEWTVSEHSSQREQDNRSNTFLGVIEKLVKHESQSRGELVSLINNSLRTFIAMLFD